MPQNQVQEMRSLQSMQGHGMSLEETPSRNRDFALPVRSSDSLEEWYLVATYPNRRHPLLLSLSLYISLSRPLSLVLEGVSESKLPLPALGGAALQGITQMVSRTGGFP